MECVTQHVSRSVPSLVLVLCALLLASCGLPLPGDAAPVVKIGVIAPFEGLGRPLGYALLPALRAAVAEANADGSLGRYRVLLVALNDDLYGPTAAAQARALLADPDVLAVLGPWSAATAAAAAPILGQGGLPALPAAPASASPLIFPLCPPPASLATEQTRMVAETGLAVERFAGDAAQAADALLARPRPLLGGPDLARPWLIGRAGAAAGGTRAAVCVLPAAPALAADAGDAALANEARLAAGGTHLILAALASDIAAHGQPSRSGVAAALAAQPPQPGWAWLQVVGDAWAPVAGE